MFWSKSSDDNSSGALAAPTMIESILIPVAVIGHKSTAVRTENLPPTSSGTTNVSYPSLSANCLNNLNATAGSVVVADLEITFTEKSLYAK